jgi:hypothetical protein
MPARIPLLLALLGMSMTLQGQADAQSEGGPMTFDYRSVGPREMAVFASGEITPETPGAFSAFLDRTSIAPDTMIFFNSAGGDLRAGMQLGRLVRKAHLNTGVATPEPSGRNPDAIQALPDRRVYPGYCVSACALAFLGGVSRKVDPGAVLAVHQVRMDCVEKGAARGRFPWVLLPGVNYCPDLEEALSMVQVAGGAVVEYVRSMGADPIFLSEMARAGPASLNALSEKQLDEYRINFTLRTETWAYEADADGQFFLRHTQADEWKEDRIEFFCERRGKPRLLMWLVHDTRTSQGRADASELAALAVSGLAVSWRMPAAGDGSAATGAQTVRRDEIVVKPVVTEHGNLTLTLDVSKRFLDVLTSADRFQLTPASSMKPGDAPPVLIAFSPDRNRIAGMMRSCR